MNEKSMNLVCVSYFRFYCEDTALPSHVPSPSFLVLECVGSKKVGPGIHCLCMHYKTKKVPKKNVTIHGGKELINGISHISPRWAHTASGHLRRKL